LASSLFNIIDDIIFLALREDMGTGDITAESTIDSKATLTATFTAKDEGVIAGIDTVKRVWEILDSNLVFESFMTRGDRVKSGDKIATVSGNAVNILTGERTCLNFMQRASGIATLTARYVQAVAHTNARIVDTRKTVPGLRVLDKFAVYAGGGDNHRFSLSDGVLIKDNHILASGSITEAVKRAKRYAPHTVKIEVECENMDHVREALSAGADILMLDNMSCDMMRDCVHLCSGRAMTEASGGITLDNVAEVAETGVDLISIGALTHSALALDISLDF